jgi:hypothetical protein
MDAPSRSDGIDDRLARAQATGDSLESLATRDYVLLLIVGFVIWLPFLAWAL